MWSAKNDPAFSRLGHRHGRGRSRSSANWPPFRSRSLECAIGSQSNQEARWDCSMTGPGELPKTGHQPPARIGSAPPGSRRRKPSGLASAPEPGRPLTVPSSDRRAASGLCPAQAGGPTRRVRSGYSGCRASSWPRPARPPAFRESARELGHSGPERSGQGSARGITSRPHHDMDRRTILHAGLGRGAGGAPGHPPVQPPGIRPDR